MTNTTSTNSTNIKEAELLKKRLTIILKTISVIWGFLILYNSITGFFIKITYENLFGIFSGIVIFGLPFTGFYDWLSGVISGLE